MRTSLALLAAALVLGACATGPGAGTTNVTCQTMTFVYLSKKDTPGTIKQVALNNASWISTCGNPPAPPKKPR
jgi:hypothetical protein